ncbi:MAG TPA: CAP domain-containing protein [Microvirga sp.]|nr:CAP domain-containing protein [Microvirga sp.]
MSQATAFEQLMLELVNAARARTGAQPLAFNSALNTSADRHSDWMIAADTFSHTGSGGSSPTQRMTKAGYKFSGAWASAENIAWVSTRAPSGYQDEVQLLHKNLMNSPGHKANILKGTFREIGIGFDTGAFQGWNGAFVTENFARSGSKIFLTGVALDDRDGDRFYDVGEGLGGLTVTAVGSSGVRTATTGAAGGYSLALSAGTYKVTFSGGGITPVTKTVTIGAKNVKLDLVDPATGAAAAQAISGTSVGNTLNGTSGADTIKGYAGADTVYGRGGSDKLCGGAGNDRISGQAGNDRLYGEDGKDVLNGGAGNDALRGGAGADSFRFRDQWGADTVSDFQNGSDRIDLRGAGLSFNELSIAQRDADRDGRADDVVIKADGQSIALLNLKASLVGVSDFVF